MIKMYILNLGFMLNKVFMTLVGQDPRKTISAFLELNAHRKGWIKKLRDFVNRIYKKELVHMADGSTILVTHTEEAATGWGYIVDRSLWWKVPLKGR